MGIILSRVRKKKSTIETLEKLDNDIKEIQESGVNVQKKYKKITKLFLICSVVLYILCGIIFYFQFTSTLQGKLLYLVPLAISPLLLYIVKRIVSWYYDRLLNKNRKRLNEMKKEKKKILEEVMDKETYKVAKQILEKFSDESVPKGAYNMQLQVNKPDDGLRKRMLTPISSAPMTTAHINRNVIASHTPRPNIPAGGVPAVLRPVPKLPVPAMQLSNPAMQLSTPALQLPAPIIPLHRSYIDRVVEYLIGDGPNNRYALICSQCHSHNGMALKEEFEYIGFKCCYCLFFNPARKVRPEAPKLESFMTSHEPETDSEKTDEENSDGEHKPGIEEWENGAQKSSPASVANNDDGVSSVDKNSIESNKEPETATDAGSPRENVEKEIVENFEEKKVENYSENSDQPEELNNANCDESLVKS